MMNVIKLFLSPIFKQDQRLIFRLIAIVYILLNPRRNISGNPLGPNLTADIFAGFDRIVYL